ncbi:MAG: methyltransferase [Candidatus Aenigmarchaeota archaeon]|nr:methyltransferase [Candidatus Aenigmarchaeota archaeon]
METFRHEGFYYQPLEDSYLMLECAKEALIGILKKKGSKIKILDMGTGSGVIANDLAEFCAKNRIKADIFGIDLNRHGIRHALAERKGEFYVLSDLFGGLKGIFDIIVFNPPYLPEGYEDFEEEYKKTVIGGRKGNELACEFVRQASKHMDHETVCLLLASSLSGKNEIEKICRNCRLKMKAFREKSLFFEKLAVYEIRK